MATTESTEHVHHSLRERFGVLDTTAVTFTKTRATQAAAGLAYYTFFSLFPLMLLLILVGSFFLDRQSVMQRVTQLVQGALPISQQFVVQNLQQVLQQRTAVGIFVLVSLLWSASSMFDNLAYHINEAWPEAKARNFIQSRLIGLDMIVGLTVLILVSVILDSLARWLGGATSASGVPVYMNPWALVSAVGSWIAIFMLFVAMYRWVPTVHVSWSASLWGALAAAIGWKAATTAFAWYLGSPFAHYQLVYGSLGAIVAFLFLIYIIALVTLFGAHLTAAIDHLQYGTAAAKPALVESKPTRRDTSGTEAVPVTGDKPEPEPQEDQPEQPPDEKTT